MDRTNGTDVIETDPARRKRLLEDSRLFKAKLRTAQAVFNLGTLSKQKEAITIKGIKPLLICTLIISIILIVFTSLEFLILKILGLQYESLWSLLLFFLVYGLSEIPINLFLSALLKALTTLNVIQSHTGMLALFLHIMSTFIIVNIIDRLMTSVSISQLGISLFSLVTGLVGWLSIQQDPDSPKRGSKEFEAYEKR
ncbi:YrvL family regulatory protein [Exiguobacterium sp. s36]|uniref:YrvL family regulatory protein n=1 Tax=Exiguobacterium sp. s36 TaxID=2751227 RepID=UPI003335032A